MARTDTVDHWFDAWVIRMLECVGRGDWPDLDGPYWLTIKRMFTRAGATEAVADEAIQLLAEDAPDLFGKVLPELKRHVQAIHAAKPQAAGPGGMTRDEARHAARGCECYGEGLAIRYRRRSAVAGRNNAVVFYCRCASGRWLQAADRAGDEESRAIARRIPDLADYPWLWGDEYRDPPFAVPTRSCRPADVARKARLIDLARIGEEERR